MRFDSITIQNFLSIKSIKLDLSDRGLVLIKGVNKDNPALNNNGSGKSSMIEAIIYALYGRTIRGIKGDSVVNNVTGKNMKIFLDLTDDNDDKYRIARYRKHNVNKNKSILYRNGKDITPKSEADFNKAVADLLQADYVTFTSSLLYSAESFKFTSSSDAEMKATFDNMLGLDIFSNCLEITKNRLKEVELTVATTEDKISSIEQTIERVKVQVEEAKQKQQQYEDSRQEKVKSIQKSVDEYEEKLQKFKKKLEELLEEKEELEDKQTELLSKKKKAEDVLQSKKEALKQVDELKSEITDIKSEVSSKQASIKRLEKSIKSSNEEIDSYTTRIERYKSKISTLEEKKKELDSTIGSPCPTCGQPMTAESIEPAKEEYDEQITDVNSQLEKAQSKIESAAKEIEEYNSQIAEEQQEIDELQETLEEFEGLVSKSKKLVDDKTEAEDALAKVNEKFYEVKSAIKGKDSEISSEQYKVKTTEDAISSTDKRIQEVQEAENPYTAIIKTHKDNIIDYEDTIEEFRESIKDKLDEKTCLEFWKQAYSNQGIKSLILDDITPFLNRRVNKYLKKLSSGHIEAQFTTQTTLKSGEVREKFSVTVTNSDGGTEYTSNSGGEKRRIDLAINLALSDLVASRSTKRLSIAIYDEVFDTLDDVGVENVISLLQELADEKSSIFVISHNSHLQSYFNNIITVVKENGCSTLLEQSEEIADEEV